MDKLCEFCMALRPVVYCKSDAAHLCLPCDARIHSANALFSRHLRTILCESCRYRSAYVRCFDHQMFMCHGCDYSQHSVSSEHEKRVISSYMGCPSAKDLAAMWDFDLNKLDFVDTGVVNLDIPRQSCRQIGSSSLASEIDSDVESSSRHSKACNKAKKQENSCVILQQILDLNRLQLTDGNNNASLICSQEQSKVSSSKDCTTWELDGNLDQPFQHSLSLRSDLKHVGSPHFELNAETFQLPFSQLDNGDSFWECRSPVHSGQLWSHNMQDLGVCEEISVDDFNIPDVDLTFSNFEEFFGGEQDSTRTRLSDKDMACSYAEKDTFCRRSDNDYSRAMEDTTLASSLCTTQSTHGNKDIGHFDEARHLSTSKDCFHPIRPPCSILSFSLSRLSAESSDTDYLATRLSPIIVRQEPSCDSPKENETMKYKAKNQVRGYEKRIRYVSRKAKVGVQKRLKGRFTKAEDDVFEAVNVTNSY